MDRAELDLLDRRAESERRVAEHYTRMQRGHLESLRVAEQEVTNQRLTFNLALHAAQQRARAMRTRTDVPAPQAFSEYRSMLEQRGAQSRTAEHALRKAEAAVETRQRALSEVQQQMKVHDARVEVLVARRQAGLNRNEARAEAAQGEELCAMVAGKQQRASACVSNDQYHLSNGMRLSGAPTAGDAAQNQNLRALNRSPAPSRREESVDSQDGSAGAGVSEGGGSSEVALLTLMPEPTSLAATTTGEGMMRREPNNQGPVQAPACGSGGGSESATRLAQRGGTAAAGSTGARTDVLNVLTPTDSSSAPLVQFGYRLQGGQIVRVELKKNEQGAIEVQLAPELFADRHLLARSLREVRNSMRQHGFKVRV